MQLGCYLLEVGDALPDGLVLVVVVGVEESVRPRGSRVPVSVSSEQRLVGDDPIATGVERRPVVGSSLSVNSGP